MNIEKPSNGGWKDKLGKAARASAAYGVLAAGAYGTYQVIHPSQEAQCQEPARAGDDRPQVWVESGPYAAQTRFLKTLYAVYDRGNGRIAAVRKGIDETYAKARADLGAMFRGDMAQAVDTVEILEGGALAVTLTYEPAPDSDLSKYTRVRIRYHIGTREAAIELGMERLVKTDKDVRILQWQGFDPAKGEWVDIPVQPAMAPTEASEEEEEPQGCNYPRWNPRGVRYGFLRARDLGVWFD